MLLYYDYLLTLEDEIESYWPPRRPLTWLSGLFLGTRYFTLLAFVPVLVSMVWGTEAAVCVSCVYAGAAADSRGC